MIQKNLQSLLHTTIQFNKKPLLEQIQEQQILKS